MENLKKLFRPNRQIFMAGGPEGTSLEGQKPTEKKQEGGGEGNVDVAKQEGGKVVGAQMDQLGKLEATELTDEDVQLKVVEIFNNRDYPFSGLQNKLVEAEKKSSSEADQKKLAAALKKLGVTETGMASQPQPGTVLSDMYTALWEQQFKVKKTPDDVAKAIKAGKYQTLKSGLDGIIAKAVAAFDEVYGKGNGQKEFEDKKKEANT